MNKGSAADDNDDEDFRGNDFFGKSRSDFDGRDGTSEVPEPTKEEVKAYVDSLDSREALFLKQNVEQLFQHMITDKSGDTTFHIKKKIHALHKESKQQT